ncbi:MAG: hypothetical protein C4530_06615 [Desulfobacteraceae bacterium]|nr:MAG: hypothetical protein C4530_06615 [Desulfobacteraceae bacterium]
MAVIGVEVTRKGLYTGGQSFGKAGVYERTDGVLTFAVDPENEANRHIVDLKLAPRDSKGRVRFRSDFSLLAPKDPSRGNGRLLVDIVNRGRKKVVDTFNRAPSKPEGSWENPPGDGFLFVKGYSVVSIGWQWDVHRSDALLGLEAPQAQIADGPFRGQTIVEIRPNVPEKTRLLANRIHQPYRAARVDDDNGLLLVRDWEDGPETVIPRSRWRFARETEKGVVASAEHIYLETGFIPGKIYHFVYTPENAPVVGTGLLAVRDAAVWLRHPSDLNPVSGGFERIYGYGVSQTGRLLRHFLYLGLNRDEEGRIVYDGLIPHVAGGRRGEFNHRFAQPSQQSAPGFGQLFPFADNEEKDPSTGSRDGLLRRLRQSEAVPKVFYTNTSAEYWRGDGSLIHIDPIRRSDLEPAPEARIYHFAGTQHIPGSLPLAMGIGPDGSRGRHPFSIVDYRPLLRAAIVNLDLWTSEGIEPPPSRHPRLDDQTAVPRADLLSRFTAVPHWAFPDPERLWVVREIDLGADAGSGIARYPVREGKTCACYVSAVDSDGNEVAGIRLPDLEFPIGTHTGWNLRHPETGAPEQMIAMQGSTSFFAPSVSARKAADDPRPSLPERYRNREEYIARVREAALRLAADRYLLEEDVEIVVSACAQRYDAAMAAV